MPTARETSNSDSFEPNNPLFGRVADPNGVGQVKYAGVESEYGDITRGPAANLATVRLRFDVPATVRKVSFLLQNTVVTITAALNYAGVAIIAMPDRNVAFLGAEFVGTVTGAGDFATLDDPVIGIGTATAGATPIATTAVNIIPATTLTDIVAGAATAVAVSTQSTVATVATLHIPDTATTLLYLNASAPAGQLAADGTLTFNGIVDIYYIDLGNRGS